jgi:hypothetical protein
MFAPVVGIGRTKPWEQPNPLADLGVMTPSASRDADASPSSPCVADTSIERNSPCPTFSLGSMVVALAPLAARRGDGAGATEARDRAWLSRYGGPRPPLEWSRTACTVRCAETS